MTTYSSPIILGAKYTDHRTQISGYAVSLWFNQEGCIEVNLEFVKDGKVEYAGFAQERLTTEDAKVLAARGKSIIHESDIILGELYEDIQTGIKGHATVMEFHEYQANRVTIRGITTNADGSAKMTYYSIDDFLLKHVETAKTVKRQDDRPSPITREVERR